MLTRDPRAHPLTRLAMATAAIGLFLAAYYWGNQYKQGSSQPPAIQGVLVLPANPVAGFELQDATGESFTADNLAEHWTLLSFGDPSQASGHRAVTRLVEIHNRLASQPSLQEMLQIALAARRQQSDLARDFERLSPALKVLAGEPEELRRLRAAIGAHTEEETAAMAAEAPVYLIGPSGRLLALFPDAQEPASIASDLSAIAEYSDSLPTNR